MTFGLSLAILDALVKTPDAAAELRRLVLVIKGLDDRTARKEAAKEAQKMLNRHARVATLRGVDLTHDIALMLEDLTG